MNVASDVKTSSPLTTLLRAISLPSLAQDSQVFFLMVSGPLLIGLALSLALIRPAFSEPLTPFLALTGIFLCFKWQAKGCLLSLSILFLYFLVKSLLVVSDVFFWHLGWNLSLSIGLIITHYSLEEALDIVKSKEKQSDADILALKVANKGMEEKMLTQEKNLQSSLEALRITLTKKEKECDSLTDLIKVSSKEAEKYCKLHHAVTEEALLAKREALLYADAAKELKSLKENLRIKERLKELNTIRTNHFELQLHCKNLEDKIAKYISLLQKKSEISQENLPNHTLTLEIKEKEKEKLKAVHEELLKDYKILKAKIDTLISKSESTSDREEKLALDKLYKESLASLEEKKELISKAKANLVRIERELFGIKKEMNPV